MKFAHTNIITTDWKRLADFYIKTFDCSLAPPIRNLTGAWLDKGLGIENATLKGAHLKLPGYGVNGPTLEIFEYSKVEGRQKAAPNAKGLGHIAFEVADVAETLGRLIKNGGSSLGEITHQAIEGAGELTFVYARDPDGNIIELQCWK